ncbi:MAG: hypothetical protein U0325_05130 [Polyangiales bacterium]
MTTRRTLRPPLIQFVDALSTLSIAEASALVQALEEKLGVSSTPSSPFAASGAFETGWSTCNPPELHVSFRSRSFGPRRVEVIKTLLRRTGWSLSEVLLLERGPKDLCPDIATLREYKKICDEIRQLGADVALDIQDW